MIELLIISIIGISLFTYCVILCLRPIRESEWTIERDKYFNNMRWFEIDEWYIFDSYYKIESFEELREINRTIEKAIKNANKNKEVTSRRSNP